ncbi:MbtH-like protein [Actinokineospora spheciospongiae]|uniref:MbtH-like protein n=1 Tax=Actinokineospora spheciospongiae TaxID=909613 RepID=W7ISS7_9PSEU|nr:MbtH-like protein [Actinokineospora spheciospongiae]
MAEEQDDTQVYRVVVNHEEQYSIWPVGRDIPAGWQADGTEGSKAQCLEHIEEVWTDMRPRSLRERMAKSGMVQRPRADCRGEHDEDEAVERGAARAG